MTVEYSEIRSAVLEYLRTNPCGEVGESVLQAVEQVCQRRGVRFAGGEAMLLEQVFHDLYLEGLIVPNGSAGMVTFEVGKMSWPKYRLTEYGKNVLATPDYVPHDPDGYLATLAAEIHGLDAVILRYLEEALRCFKSGLLLAAAVMTGCAAEKALLLLVDAFGKAIPQEVDRNRYRKETSSWMVSQKHAALWKRLEANQASLPEHLRADLHENLDRAFDLIRKTRNEAGHPAGRTPSRDSVRANFILFPIYCKQIYGLIAHFAQSQVPTADKS